VYADTIVHEQLRGPIDVEPFFPIDLQPFAQAQTLRRGRRHQARLDLFDMQDEITTILPGLVVESVSSTTSFGGRCRVRFNFPARTWGLDDGRPQT
jgi:hypothetical protein